MSAGGRGPTPAFGRRATWLADPHTLLALAAGPAVWLGLLALGLPRASSPAPLATLLHGALLVPALEEIVFRGAVQGALLGVPALARRHAGLSGANVLTSLAFAAAHLWSQPPLWAAAVLAPSLVFGHLRERHGTLLAPTLVHGIYNAGFIALFVGGP